MSTVLVTGSGAGAADMDRELRAGDRRVVVSASVGGNVADALAGHDPHSVEYYVQMPAVVEVALGAAAVTRVRTFLTDGLMARFAEVEAALPYLSDDASVLLVSGSQALVEADSSPSAIGSAATPDDRGARVSLLLVLAEALRRDHPAMRVHVAERGAGIEALAAAVLSGQGLQDGATGGSPTTPDTSDSGDYEDWRTQMLGMSGGEF